MENMEQVRVFIAPGGGKQVLKAGTAGEEVRIRKFIATLRAEGYIQFTQTDGTVIAGPFDLSARGGFVDSDGNYLDLALVAALGQGINLESDVGVGGYAKVSSK